MTDSDKIIMTLNIGGERFNVNVPFDSQLEVREAEKAAGSMTEHIKKKFPMASDASVMARVAYRLAYRLIEMSKQETQASGLIDNAQKKLDSILASS